MKTRLWLDLFEAIHTNSDFIDEAFQAFESIVVNKQEYQKDLLSYKKAYSKKGFPPNSIPPFTMDRREEKKGDTLLITAARQQNFPVVRRLIQDGAFVHVKNNQGQTALYHAVNNDDVKMAVFLLSKGAKFAEIELNSLYALLSRTTHAIDWLKLLDGCKVNVTKPDQQGFSLIDHAVKAKNFPLIELLLARKVPFPVKQVLNEFKTSSSEVQNQWVDLSVEHKINLDSVTDDKNTDTALYYCANQNNVSGARKLLEAKASTKLRSVDFFPYDDSHVKLAELLSEYKFPIVAGVWGPLNNSELPVEKVMSWTKLFASNCNYNKQEVLDLVLSRRAKLDDIASVKVLLQEGANPNFKYGYNDFGIPINYAIQNKNIPMSKLLISKGAVADPTDIMQLMYKDGYIQKDCIDLMILLKENNPHLDIANVRHKKYLDTPLISAAFVNDFNSLLKLLNFSDTISVNLVDTKNKSALDYGIEQDNIQIIHALLSHGATFNKDQENKIYDIISKTISSSDASLKYAAVSCLNILYVQTNKDEYKKQLEQHEKLIADVMPEEHLLPPLNRIVREHLFFHSKSLYESNKKEETQSIQGEKAPSP